MKDPVASIPQATTHDRVLSMFRSGSSKADIARAIGKEKKQVGRILAEAIRNVGTVNCTVPGG